jgi:hypothetical protein
LHEGLAHLEIISSLLENLAGEVTLSACGIVPRFGKSSGFVLDWLRLTGVATTVPLQ